MNFLPKGCSLSGGRLLSFAPIIVIIDVAESVKLLKASEMIAILLTISPIINFIVNNSTLQIIPRIPERTLYFSLTETFAVFSWFGIKCLIKNLIIDFNSLFPSQSNYFIVYFILTIGICVGLSQQYWHKPKFFLFYIIKQQNFSSC